MADIDSFETCPTDIVHASPERVWELLTVPARLDDWLGVKVIEAPAHNLAVGDRLVFGPAPGLRLSWDVLSVEPPRALELNVKAPFGIRNHEESRRREFHPPPLAEPGVNLSTHRAPIVQPPGLRPTRQWANSRGDRRETSASSSPARLSRRRSRLYLRMAQRTR